MNKEQYTLIQTTLCSEKTVLLNYFKSKLPLYHNSNIFFRDLQYVIQSYLELKSIKPGYTYCEQLTKDFLAYLEQQNEAKKVSENGWMINIPIFRKGAVTES